ncbi:MAG: cardiolipin synthase, partial [Gemmatimonadota bacterium]
WLVRIAMFVVIVTRKRSAGTALAWLAIVAFVPFVGALAYFLLGEVRLGKRRSRQYQQLQDAVDRSPELRRQFARHGHVTLTGSYRTVAHMAGAVGAREPRPGNRIELIDAPLLLFERLVRDIDRSEYHCHLLFYIADDSENDPVTRAVGDALMRAADRGVACRVLLDAAGSRRFLRGSTARQWREEGVKVEAALPVNPVRAMAARLDLRNHRKLCVIDGLYGYMGSHNLTDPIYPGKEAFGDWMDASVRIEGPVVYDLQEVFLHDWAFSVGTLPGDGNFFPALSSAQVHEGIAASLLPTAPSTGRSPLLDVILQTLQLSRERVVLTTPYFVPDDSMLQALRSASLRGVNVILVVPKRGDHALTQAAGRSHYGFLLDAGVEIREYPGALLHAKTLTMDRELAILGSANLDVRSFSLSFELALLVYDTDFASQLYYLQSEYLARAERLTRGAWERRGPLRSMADNVARLVTPLL